MKPIVVLSFIFFILFLGLHSQVSAQGRGTVSYTIVVTEDMLAQHTGRDYQSGTGEMGLPAASVSVSMQNGNTYNPKSQSVDFHMDVYAAQPDDFLPLMIGGADPADESSYDVSRERFALQDDTSDYLVVMEFN